MTPLALLDSPWYVAALIVQVLFYLAAVAAFVQWAGIQRTLFGKVSLYFSTVNAAILAAWYQYGRGVRQELWTPSNR